MIEEIVSSNSLRKRIYQKAKNYSWKTQKYNNPLIFQHLSCKQSQKHIFFELNHFVKYINLVTIGNKYE